MSEHLSRFDTWIREDGPSALVLKECLEPAGGSEEVIFPPTFAPPEDERNAPAGYVIDGDGENSVCLIDSVGSQSNRLEPLFQNERYRRLVPQVQIQVGDRVLNLLDLGHRAADAVARSSTLADELEAAFAEFAAGNAVSLAKVAPTSIVFGSWDSRGSQTKVSRLISSTIRAYHVQELHRAAQYFAALANDEVSAQLGADVQKERKTLSKAGFLDAPSGRTHGGIIVHGRIERSTIVNLTALRTLGAPTEDAQTTLRRYILSLTLLAASAPIDLFLRQGCLLVQSIESPPQSYLVYRDGRREMQPLVPAEIGPYAEAAAQAFGVGEDRNVAFSSKAAKDAVKKAAKTKEESKGEN